MSVTPLLPNPIFYDSRAPSGQLFTYIANTTTPQVTYSDAAGTVPNTNPVILDTTGAAIVRLGAGLAYDFVLKDQSGTVTIDTINNYIQPLYSYTLTQAAVGAALYPQSQIETTATVTATNTIFPYGSFYRYGAKGGAGRTADGVITAGSAIITSASGGFASAQAGMVVVVVDGGPARSGGRPIPLNTTILSVQSANQITLSATVTQAGTVTMNGTLNSTTAVSATSVNPITTGVGLTRNWTVTGTNIPANTTIAATTSSTLTLSAAATGAGVTALTLTAPIEVCFGFDDKVAIAAALSLPYAITDVKDNFLTTQALTFGGTGCNDLSMPSTLIIFAIGNNTSHCVTAAGLDRGNSTNYLVGLRYLPFKFELGEMDCCNTGLDAFSLGPSMYSNVRTRITNAFRNALGEFFLTANTWQEGNYVDINCGRVGLHFHHKVTKSNGSFQNLSSYRIMGRSPGLNSVFLGINAGTQPDQCGGGIRLYTAGVSVADGGMSQNVWGGQTFCELDGERSVALSFGSDICNSPVVHVDASANYVIEGTASAAFSNAYRSNNFLNMVIEDISQASDARGGYQFYAMANTTTNQATVLSTSAGPWGQTYASPLMLSGSDNLIRWPARLSYPGLLLTNDATSGGNQFRVGYLGLPANTQSTNYTLVASDAGKCIVNSAGTQTIPQNTFSASQTVDILAFGGGLSIAAGAGVTMNWFNGTTLVTTTPRTLANGARATLYFVGANSVSITAPSGLT